MKILNTLTSLYHVEHDTCTVRGRNIKTRYFGLKWPCDKKGIDILSNTIECNYLSRDTSSLLHSKSCEIEDWRSLVWEITHVSSTTTNDLITTRSRLDRGNEMGSTVEQQPVGKPVQLSSGKIQQATFSQLTQPKPNLCSIGENWWHRRCVDQRKTSRSQEIDEKRLHEELDSSDRSGKLDGLSENTRVKRGHDGTGQLVEQNSSSTHIVKEQFVPEENRDIASFDADNEFNRAINEENIDFNIPGVPNSTVKRSHAFNVIFNNIDILILSAKNHETWLKQLQTSNCVNYSMLKPKAQCKACLSYWDVRIV